MRVLFLTSGNTQNIFVKEQADALSELGVDPFFYSIQGKGILGYLSCLDDLKKTICLRHPAIVHAHYGLSGVLANLQRTVPVITTYHGCDINRLALRWWSSIPLVFSRNNIFVSQAMHQKIHWLNKTTHFVIPMGVNTHAFYEMDQKEARKQLNLDLDKTYVLFSSDFLIPVKNYELAVTAIDMLEKEVELLELKGYSREQVNLLMNACDAGLLTSVREGSPMFVKELMCVNRQIVATDVGDVKTVCGDIPGCHVTGFDPGDIAEKINLALQHSRTEGRTKGRERIFQLGLDGRTIAKKVLKIYRQVVPKG
jgi:glycosyltransferase involved in cell wall biosynthesis